MALGISLLYPPGVASEVVKKIVRNWLSRTFGDEHVRM